MNRREDELNQDPNVDQRTGEGTDQVAAEPDRPTTEETAPSEATNQATETPQTTERGDTDAAATDQRRDTTNTQSRDTTDGLFSEESSRDYSSRWESVQATFVDDPRAAVEHAEGLVDEVVRHIADSFSKEREDMEAQWSSGQDVSTEDLRVALQRYRAFFQRLLDV